MTFPPKPYPCPSSDAKLTTCSQGQEQHRDTVLSGSTLCHDGCDFPYDELSLHTARSAAAAIVEMWPAEAAGHHPSNLSVFHACLLSSGPMLSTAHVALVRVFSAHAVCSCWQAARVPCKPCNVMAPSRPQHVAGSAMHMLLMASRGQRTSATWHLSFPSITLIAGLSSILQPRTWRSRATLQSAVAPSSPGRLCKSWRSASLQYAIGMLSHVNLLVLPISLYHDTPCATTGRLSWTMESLSRRSAASISCSASCRQTAGVRASPFHTLY